MRPSFLSIRAFVAVYEEHSFTAAASREHATQPGISQHVRQLERMLGVRLFTRSKSRVVPTPAAHAYYSHCVSILSLLSEATRDAQEYKSSVESEVRVGVSPALTQEVIGRAVAIFTKTYPNVALQLIGGYPDTLTNKVLAEELDFAITIVDCRAGISTVPFVEAKEVLVSRTSRHFRHLEPVSLGRCELPLRLVLPSCNSPRRRALDAYLAAAGTKISSVVELDSVSGSLAVVSESESDWYTLLPMVAVAHEIVLGRFCINPLHSPQLVTTFSVVTPSRRELSVASAAFRDALLKAIGMTGGGATYDQACESVEKVH